MDFHRVVLDYFFSILADLSIIFVFVYSLSGDSGQRVRALEASIPRQDGTEFLFSFCLHTGLDQNAFPPGGAEGGI